MSCSLADFFFSSASSTVKTLHLKYPPVLYRLDLKKYFSLWDFHSFRHIQQKSWWHLKQVICMHPRSFSICVEHFGHFFVWLSIQFEVNEFFNLSKLSSHSLATWHFIGACPKFPHRKHIRLSHRQVTSLCGIIPFATFSSTSIQYSQSAVMHGISPGESCTKSSSKNF